MLPQSVKQFCAIHTVLYSSNSWSPNGKTSSCFIEHEFKMCKGYRHIYTSSNWCISLLLSKKDRCFTSIWKKMETDSKGLQWIFLHSQNIKGQLKWGRIIVFKINSAVEPDFLAPCRLTQTMKNRVGAGIEWAQKTVKQNVNNIKKHKKF